LRRWLCGKGRYASSVASELGVDKATVYYWLQGRSLPRLDARMMIASMTHGEVPADSWRTRVPQ
jgi:hypothetical protein